MLALNREGKNPLYHQLFRYFVNEIVEGRLPFGCKLPSKRKLSAFLNVSLNTIDYAYQQLLAEGYIQSRPRSGMFVIYKNELVISPINKNTFGRNHSLPQEKVDTIDFSHGKVDTDNFPYSIIRKYARQLLSKENAFFFQNGPFQGSVSLRREITTYLYQSRGVICDPSQVVIGSGTQILLEQILRLIPQDVPFAMENPGFHRVRELIRFLGRKQVNIPVESDGVTITPIKNMDTGVVYITPSHQFPLGMILPISKRVALVEWARRKEDRYIIEDDYDGEFRYIGKPIPSLQGLDKGHSVIYLGTFSKSLIPSLRVSYAVLPKTLVGAYQKLFSLIKQTASTLNQELICLFMRNGDWEHHLNRMRTIYKHNHQVIVHTIHEHLSPSIQVIGENSGLHLILEIDNGMDEKKLISSALINGVTIYPTSVYYASGIKPINPRILLGYAGLNEKQIQKGILCLRQAWIP